MKKKWEKAHSKDTYTLKTFSLPRGIIVHRHMDYPGEWRMSAYDLGMTNIGLELRDLESAKNEAATMVRLFAQRVAQELE